MMVLFLLRMFGIDQHHILEYPLVFLVGLKAFSIADRTWKIKIVSLINCFIVYCCISGIAYFFNGLPFKTFLYTINIFILPCTFFYLGYYCKPKTNFAFEKNLLIGVLFCNIVGFYLHFSAPPFYLELLAQKWSKETGITEDNVLDFARYGSFFIDSYYICFLSVSSLALYLYYFQKKVWRDYLSVIFIIFSFIASILCLQRIAVAFALLIPIFYLYVYKVKISKRILIYFSLCILLGIVFGYNYIDPEVFSRTDTLLKDMVDRFSLTKALGERSHQYEGFDRGNLISYIWGLGLGSCGHFARGFGLRTINDNEFMRLFYDLGIVGCSLLYYIIIITLYRGWRFIKRFFPYFCIVLFYFASFIGCDPLDIDYIISLIFWYSIGKIWNPQFHSNHLNDYKTRIEPLPRSLK